MKPKQRIKRLKKWFLTLGVGVLTSSVFAPTIVSAHDAYYLSVTVDPDNIQLIGMVGEDKNNNGINKHAEVNHTGVYFGEHKGGKTFVRNDAKSVTKFSLPYTESGHALTKVGEAYEAFLPKSDTTTDTLLFSFPGRHVSSVGNIATGNKRDADGMDRQQAQWVNRNLVGGLNQAISYVYNIAYSDMNETRGRTINIARGLANHGANAAGVNGNGKGASSTFTVNGKKFKVEDGRDVKDRDPDIPANHYIKITHGKENPIYFPWAVPKGYGEDQRLWLHVKGSPYEKVYKEDVRFLTWQHVALQAIYNSSVTGVEFSAADQLNPPNIVEKMIAGVLSSIQSGIESLLGLHTLPELMLNRGSYASKNWKGVMPLGLADVADYAHLFVQFISWLLLAGAFAKLLAMRNLSALNPKMRVELKEGAMDIIGAGFALLMFIPIFNSLLIMNEGLVTFFGGMSDKVDLFGKSAMTNGGYIAPILVGFVMFAIVIYMNVTYIMRGITIAALYVFAPLFIASIAYGGKFKQLFSTFAKELVGLIFMQTIHALLLGMYSLAFFNGASTGMLYTLVLSASFIPITKFIRNDLLGMKEGMGGQMAGGAITAGAGLAFAGASVMKTNSDMKKMGSGGGDKSTNFNRRGSNNGGGGGGTEQQSFQNMMDNDAKNAGGEGVGSTPGHYAGEGKAFQAKMKPEDAPEKTSLLDKAKGGVDKVNEAIDSTKYGRTAVNAAGTALKAGASVGLAAAAATAEASTGASGISQGVTRMAMNNNMAKRMSGGYGGGGDLGSQGGSSHSIPMPDHSTLEQFEVGEAGYVAGASKENGDIVNIHDTNALNESTGIENMMDNGSHVLAKTNVGVNDDETLQGMMDDFNSGDAEKIAHWNEQGVDFAKETADGKVLLGFNKESVGINDFEKDDKYSKFDMKPTANNQFFKYKDFAPRPEPASVEEPKEATG